MHDVACIGRIALMAVGGGLGLAWNTLSGRGFALGRNVFVQEGDEVVEAAEAKARLDKGALFLDARPGRLLRDGPHPGRAAPARGRLRQGVRALEPRLRASLDIVVYCAGFGCEASHIVARKLKERGIPAVDAARRMAGLEGRAATR